MPQWFLQQNREKHLLNLTCLSWLELNYINHKSVVHFHCSELQDLASGCTEHSHFQNVHFNVQFKMSSSGHPRMRDINIQEDTKITRTLKHLTCEEKLKGLRLFGQEKTTLWERNLSVCFKCPNKAGE